MTPDGHFVIIIYVCDKISAQFQKVLLVYECITIYTHKHFLPDWHTCVGGLMLVWGMLRC